MVVVVVENVFNDLVEKREREDVEGCLFKETRQKSGEEHRLGRGCHGVGKTVMRKIIVWRNWRERERGQRLGTGGNEILTSHLGKTIIKKC